MRNRFEHGGAKANRKPESANLEPPYSRVVHVRPRRVALSERGIYEPAASEKDEISAMRQLLELNGARVFQIIERVPKCYRCGCWLGSSERGTPDLTGWFPPCRLTMSLAPVHFWIEAKRRKNAVKRASQIAWVEAARRDGVIAFFANSVDSMVQGFSGFGIAIKGA